MTDKCHTLGYTKRGGGTISADQNQRYHNLGAVLALPICQPHRSHFSRFFKNGSFFCISAPVRHSSQLPYFSWSHVPRHISTQDSPPLKKNERTSGDGWKIRSPNLGWGLSPTLWIRGAGERPPRFFKTLQIGGMCENSKSGRSFYGKHH